jgi:hypothetical protein
MGLYQTKELLHRKRNKLKSFCIGRETNNKAKRQLIECGEISAYYLDNI